MKTTPECLAEVLEFGEAFTGLSEGAIRQKAKHILNFIELSENLPETFVNITDSESFKNKLSTSNIFEETIDKPMNLHEKTIAEGIEFVSSLSEKYQIIFLKGLLHKMFSTMPNFVETAINEVVENHLEIEAVSPLEIEER